MGNPLALYLLLVVAACAVLVAYEIAVARKTMARLFSAGVMPKVIRGFSGKRRVLKRAILIVGFLAIVLAWAMPRAGRGMRVVKREGADVVVALDVSTSMLSEDVKPNRMEVAKRAVSTLASRLSGNRLGLVGFAGSGFIYCPLTLDESALAMFVDFLNPGVVAEQGTDVGDAILKSLDALRASSGKGKAVVLITDGEDHSGEVADAVRLAQAQGVRIFTLGVGSQSGEPIPLRDTAGKVAGYERDRSDNVVVSRLDPTVLAEIAAQTGGASYILGLGDAEISKVAKSIEDIDKAVLEERTFEEYAEMFQIPLVLCLLLLFAEGLVGDKARRRQEGGAG